MKIYRVRKNGKNVLMVRGDDILKLQQKNRRSYERDLERSKGAKSNVAVSKHALAAG